MAFTFSKAKGLEIGKSLVDDEKIDYCKEMMAKAEKLGKKLILPVDAVAAKDASQPRSMLRSRLTMLMLRISRLTRWAWISDRRSAETVRRGC